MYRSCRRTRPAGGRPLPPSHPARNRSLSSRRTPRPASHVVRGRGIDRGGCDCADWAPSRCGPVTRSPSVPAIAEGRALAGARLRPRAFRPRARPRGSAEAPIFDELGVPERDRFPPGSDQGWVTWSSTTAPSIDTLAMVPGTGRRPCAGAVRSGRWPLPDLRNRPGTEPDPLSGADQAAAARANRRSWGDPGRRSRGGPSSGPPASILAAAPTRRTSAFERVPDRLPGTSSNTNVQRGAGTLAERRLAGRAPQRRE